MVRGVIESKPPFKSNRASIEMASVSNVIDQWAVPKKSKPDPFEAAINQTTNTVDLVAKSCDFDMYNPGWSWTWKLTLYYTDGVIFMIFAYYSLNQVWGDIVLTCFALVTVAFGVQAWHRVFYWLLKKENLQDLWLRSKEYARLYEVSSDEGQLSLKYLQRLHTAMKCIYIYLGLGAPAMFLAFILVYFINGAMLLPFQYLVPGLNSTDHPGYEINFLFQVVQGYCTCTLLVINWFIYLFPIVSILYQIEVILIKVLRLDEAIRFKVGDEESNHNEKLIEIIKLHVDLDTFIDDTEDLNGQCLLVDCGLYAFACVMVIFVETIGFYGPGVMILVVNLSTIFVICAIGTTVQSKLEELQIGLYNMTWYEMSIKNKKLFLILLLKSINCERLSAGGLRPLNLELYISVRIQLVD